MIKETVNPGMTDKEILTTAKRADELVVDGNGDFQKRVAEMLSVRMTQVTLVDTPGANDLADDTPRRSIAKNADDQGFRATLDEALCEARVSREEAAKFRSQEQEIRSRSGKPNTNLGILANFKRHPFLCIGPSVSFEMALPDEFNRKPKMASRSIFVLAVLLVVGSALGIYFYVDRRVILLVQAESGISIGRDIDSSHIIVPDPTPTPPAKQTPTPTPKPPEPLKPNSLGSQLVSGSGNNESLEIIRTLTWPIVVVLAIVLAFVLAARAMDSGHTVEFKWKVIVFGEGQMVLKKTVTRTRKAATS